MELFIIFPEVISPDVEHPKTVASGNAPDIAALTVAPSNTEEAKKIKIFGSNPANPLFIVSMDLSSAWFSAKTFLIFTRISFQSFDAGIKL